MIFIFYFTKKKSLKKGYKRNILNIIVFKYNN